VRGGDGVHARIPETANRVEGDLRGLLEAADLRSQMLGNGLLLDVDYVDGGVIAAGRQVFRDC
jgi:hypothetical protein